MINNLSQTDQTDIKQFITICQQFLGENLVSVILFGSVAKGKSNRYSDIDFCVVTKRSKDSEKYIIMKLFHRNCDVIMRTENEFAGYLQNLNALDLEICRTGTAVYGVDMIKKNKKVFEDVKRKYNLIPKTNWGKGVWEIGAAS